LADLCWSVGEQHNDDSLRVVSRQLLQPFKTTFPHSIGREQDELPVDYLRHRDPLSASLVVKLALRQQKESEFSYLRDTLMQGASFADETVPPAEIMPQVSGIVPLYKHKRKGIVQGITLPQPDTTWAGKLLQDVSLAWADAAFIDAI
jgi:hypothetical protein